MTPHQRRRIVRCLYRDGYPQYFIAQFLGVSTATVCRDVALLQKKNKLHAPSRAIDAVKFQTKVVW